MSYFSFEGEGEAEEGMDRVGEGEGMWEGWGKTGVEREGVGLAVEGHCR